MFSCTFQCCTKLLRKHGQHIMAHRISFINQYRLRFLIQHIVVFSVCYHIFQIRHDPLLTSLLLRLRQYTHNRHIKAARLLQFAAVFSDHIAVCHGIPAPQNQSASSAPSVTYPSEDVLSTESPPAQSATAVQSEAAVHIFASPAVSH